MKRECDNCGYDTKLEVFHYSGNPPRDVYLCRICANTRLSVAIEYPEQCPDTRLYKSIGWIANEILATIGAAK